MNIYICVPVIGETIELFLENLKKTQDISKLIELRIDFIKNIQKSDLDVIRAQTTIPAIVTCRKKEEGGHFDGSEEERIKILQRAIGLFDYVDVELSTIERQAFDRSDKTKLIISYHNFDQTPSYWDMQKIIHDINKHSPDIIKIVTMIQKEHEMTKIYRLLTNKPHSEKRIVIGMGEMGKMTRILGPLLGSYLTYASTEWGDSAPGQIDIQKLEEFYKSLNN